MDQHGMAGVRRQRWTVGHGRETCFACTRLLSCVLTSVCFLSLSLSLYRYLSLSLSLSFCLSVCPGFYTILSSYGLTNTGLPVIEGVAYAKYALTGRTSKHTRILTH